MPRWWYKSGARCIIMLDLSLGWFCFFCGETEAKSKKKKQQKKNNNLPATSLITGYLCNSANNIWNFSMMMTMRDNFWIADSDFHSQAGYTFLQVRIHHNAVQRKFWMGICIVAALSFKTWTRREVVISRATCSGLSAIYRYCIGL